MAKKIISVILACVIAFSVMTVAAFAKTSEEADTHLQYNEDGTFRIMQIADIQDTYPLMTATKKLIRAALEQNDVDLIVLTGDNVSGGKTRVIASAAINEFMSIFEEFEIPVAMTFGNHDDENAIATKAVQLSIYEKYDCFVGCAGEDFGDTNLCTYYVPIYSSTDANEMVNNVWIVDSGTYNSENDLGGYACVTKAQIEWYKEKSAELEATYGHKIPSFMFQHIVVPEIWDAMDKHNEYVAGSVEHGGKYYTLPEGTIGALGECPCPPNYSNGQFDAVVERGDVMAMFFGHDHTNSYEIKGYKGVDLVNTAAVTFRSYNNEEVGVRLITLNENEPDTYETQSLNYFDIFSYDDDCARYLYKYSSRTTSDATKFAALFKYIVAVIKSAFTFDK